MSVCVCVCAVSNTRVSERGNTVISDSKSRPVSSHVRVRCDVLRGVTTLTLHCVSVMFTQTAKWNRPCIKAAFVWQTKLREPCQSWKMASLHKPSSSYYWPCICVCVCLCASVASVEKGKARMSETIILVFITSTLSMTARFSPWLQMRLKQVWTLFPRNTLRWHFVR